MRQGMEQTSEVEQPEQDVTGMFLAKWQGREHTPEFAAAADDLIAGLDGKTRQKLIDSEDTNPVLLTKLKVFKFKTFYKEIEILQGQPAYQESLNGLLSMFDEDTKTALLEDGSISQDVKDVLASSPMITQSDKHPVGSRSPGELKTAFQQESTANQTQQTPTPSDGTIPSNNLVS